MKPRQCPRGTRRIGNGEPGRQAEMAEPLRQIGQQFFFAAEQMRCAGDVEEKSIGAVLFTPQRHRRRVARRPQRQLTQRGIVRGRIGGIHLQPVDLGAGIGHLFADIQPGVFSRLIERRDPCAAGSLDGEHQRLPVVYSCVLRVSLRGR